MKRIVELLVEHRPAAGHLGRWAQIEQCGLALAAVILHQYQRAQLQQRVTLGLSSFLEAVVRVGAGSVADRREQVLFARKTAIDCANAYTGAPGNLFHRHIRTALGQQIVGRTQHTLKIALGIFALTALIRLDCIHD
jgi:hypothetical protein